jgi:hypothetical protein
VLLILGVERSIDLLLQHQTFKYKASSVSLFDGLTLTHSQGLYRAVLLSAVILPTFEFPYSAHGQSNHFEYSYALVVVESSAPLLEQSCSLFEYVCSELKLEE